VGRHDLSLGEERGDADAARVCVAYAWPALLQLEGAILLKHPTLDQLHALGLHAMANAFVEIAAIDKEFA